MITSTSGNDWEQSETPVSNQVNLAIAPLTHLFLKLNH